MVWWHYSSLLSYGCPFESGNAQVGNSINTHKVHLMYCTYRPLLYAGPVISVTCKYHILLYVDAGVTLIGVRNPRPQGDEADAQT
jgi:hypothetical protein